MNLRSIRTVLAAACVAAFSIGAAHAQGSFPDKPIRLVLPYAAGGTTDVMARVMQEPLQKILGQTLIIDNRAGASGVLAAREVIRSAPDGYTLFFINNGNVAVTPFVMKDANYDGLKDFSSVALVASAPLFVVVNPSVPATDLRSFLEYAQTRPIDFASAGIGSFGHLSTELFASRAGVKMHHIPYKGQGPSTTAVLSGDVQLLVTTASSAMNGYIAQKKLRLLAVTSAEPSPLAPPGTPTVASQLPGYVADSWFAIIGPAGMPADVTARLNEAIGKVLQIPEVRQRFLEFGVLPATASPQQLHELTAAEVTRWKAVIRDNNISAE